MPLSEHEQRLLDEIERALYAEDPKFASAVRQTDLKVHRRRRLVRAGLVFAAGVVLLVTGAVMTEYAIGVAGFVLMLLAGLVVARTLSSSARADTSELGAARAARSARQRRGRGHRGGAADGSWRERFQQRWNRRWEDRD